jgi:Fe-S oxidoreductase
MGYDYKKHFGEILLTEDLTTLPEERTWRQQVPEKEAEPHQIVLYLGCNVLRTSHMIRTVTAIFDRLGLDYVAVGGPTYCCGIVHHRNGDTAASDGMNKRTVELFQRYKPEEVVMWCPSCMFFYDEIQKFPWPFPVRHTTEFLADRLPSIAFTHRVDQAVALHYHSQSAPRLREGAAGRRLLEAVPGLRVVDVGSEPRLGRLCTADVQAQLGQDVWDALIRDEIARARAGGAETLATIYHGCQRLMCGFEAEGQLAIEHYLSVFARGLGIEFEDRYKKFRLWQDPERVLEESTPCQTANRVDPARARQLVEKTFGRITATPDGRTGAAS